MTRSITPAIVNCGFPSQKSNLNTVSHVPLHNAGGHLCDWSKNNHAKILPSQGYPVTAFLYTQSETKLLV